ncbi:8857_t:CDS:2, partial [Paraglomus brasilianum]
AVAQYTTFETLIETLRQPGAKEAIQYFQTAFVGSIGPREVFTPTSLSYARFLAAEGVLYPGKKENTFKISSPLVLSLIILQVIPFVFPSAPKMGIPRRNDGLHVMDTLQVLKECVCAFDKDTIRAARIQSFKIAETKVAGRLGVMVPRETVYDAELNRILMNWLVVHGNFQIAGQWYTNTKECLVGQRRKVKNRYCDLVITPEFDSTASITIRHPGVLLELIASADEKNLEEHFERAQKYGKMIGINEKLAGLNVVHFWHDRTFDNVDMIARCLDTNGTVSDIKPERIVRPSVLHSIRNFFSYYT